MEEIVFLLNDIKLIKSLDCDSFLIPVDSLSTRSMFEYSLKEIENIKNNTDKNIYLLCDAIILETRKNEVIDLFPKLINLCDKIFFADFIYYEEALKLNMLNKLVFYSPTLAVSKEDINTWKKLGLNNVIVSKECEYTGYISILNNVKDLNLGMLALGYPQIYYSKRKMLTSYKKEYGDVQLDNFDNLTIVERTREMKMPIYEDKNGTFIFAGEVFFAGVYLKEFKDLGMKYFIIDPTFINEDKVLIVMVKAGLNGNELNIGINKHVSTFMMFKDMVNNYEK